MKFHHCLFKILKNQIVADKNEWMDKQTDNVKTVYPPTPSKHRDIIIISLHFNGNCRNKTILFCDLFIYLLPLSTVLSRNADSFWNLCWSGKKCSFLHFKKLFSFKNLFLTHRKKEKRKKEWKKNYLVAVKVLAVKYHLGSGRISPQTRFKPATQLSTRASVCKTLFPKHLLVS